MKLKNKSCVALAAVCAFTFFSAVTVHAIAPGGTFSVNIACGNIQGSVSVRGSNASIINAGNWCEQGQSISVTASAGGAGTATVSVYTADASNVTDPNNIILLPSGTYVNSSSVSVVSNNGGGSSWQPGNGNGGGSSSSQTKPETPDPEDDTHSKDNDLKSLTVSEGKLSPEFSKDTTAYTVNLPATAKSITIKAEANDTKATVAGTGEKTLEPGDNDFEITVIAENKSVKAYMVKVVVDEKPLMYITYKGAKLGVVRNIRNAPVPPNFTAATLKRKGKEIPAWKNEAMKKTIVYLVDDKNNKQFYLYENGKVTSTFTYTKLLGREVFLIDIPEAQQQRVGMNYKKLKIEDVEFMGWTFQEKSLKNYELMYVMDLDGKCRYYQYEKSQHTIQLYSGAASVTQSEYSKQVNDLKDGKTAMTYTAVALGLLAAGIGCYAAYLTIHKKK